MFIRPCIFIRAPWRDGIKQSHEKHFASFQSNFSILNVRFMVYKCKSEWDFRVAALLKFVPTTYLRTSTCVPICDKTDFGIWEKIIVLATLLPLLPLPHHYAVATCKSRCSLGILRCGKNNWTHDSFTLTLLHNYIKCYVGRRFKKFTRTFNFSIFFYFCRHSECHCFFIKKFSNNNKEHLLITNRDCKTLVLRNIQQNMIYKQRSHDETYVEEKIGRFLWCEALCTITSLVTWSLEVRTQSNTNLQCGNKDRVC